MIGDARPASRWGALSHRGYRWYAAANFLSLAGFWIQRIAIGWLVWDQTRSESWVGLIAFAQFAPALALSIPFGAMADRFDNRRMSMLLNGLFIVWAVLLAALSGLDRLTPEWLFLISLAYGCTGAAYGPVRLSIIPALVPKGVRSSAVAINAVLFNGARLIGPAIAGFILASGGAGWAFVLNALTYIPLFLVLAVIPMTGVERSAPSHLFGEVAAGLGYARRHATIFWQLMLTGWMAIFGRAVLEMLAAISDKNFDRGAAGFATLTIAAGAGAILSGVVLSVARPALSRLCRMTMALNLAAAICLLALAYVDDFMLGLGLIAILGAAATASAIASQSVVQIASQDAFRGRVASLWTMAGLGGTAIGAVLLGAVADALGLATAIMAWGGIALMLPLIMLFLGVGAPRAQRVRPDASPAPTGANPEGRYDAI